MGTDVFISYHTESSRSVVEAIVNKLESGGIRCWYAPRDVEGPYAGSITAAIKACSVFVLVLNRSASESPHVLNELDLITGRLAAKETVSIIPFHVADDEISDDAKYYIGRMHWLDAVTPPLEKRIDELAKRVRDELVSGGRLEFANDGTSGAAKGFSDLKEHSPQLKGSRISEYKNFVGRQSEIDEIGSNLKKYGKVFVAGMGGIGKSLLTKKYAYDFSSEYDCTFFLSYKTCLKDLIIDDDGLEIINFGRAGGENDDQYFERKLKMLKRLSTERTLIIVDNFDTDSDENFETFLEGSYSVIFTTRYDYSDTDIPVVNVGSLLDDEQITLFEKNYHHPLSDEERRVVSQIIATVGGHTLSIELIATLMQKKGKSPAKMLKEINELGLSSLQNGEIRHGRQTDTAYMFIKKLFNMFQLSDSEIDVLRYLSLMPKTGIDFGFFTDLSGSDSETTVGLIDKNWIIQDTDIDSIRLHPLIEEVVLNECPANAEKRRPILKRIIDFTSKGEYLELPREQNSKYKNIITSFIFNSLCIDDTMIDLYYNIIKYFQWNDEHESARKLTLACLDVTPELTVEHCIFKYYLGDIIHHKDKHYKNTLAYTEEAIQGLKALSFETLDYAYLLKYLFLIDSKYVGKRSCAELETLLDECWKVFDKSKEESSMLVESRQGFEASFNFCLAILYMKKSEYDTAIEYAEKCRLLFENCEKVLDKLWAMSPLSLEAIAFALKGDSEKAVEKAKESINASTRFLPADHYQVVERYRFYADACRYLCMPNEELTIWKKIKNMLENKNEIETLSYDNALENIDRLEKITKATEGCGTLQ